MAATTDTSTLSLEFFRTDDLHPPQGVVGDFFPLNPVRALGILPQQSDWVEGNGQCNS